MEYTLRAALDVKAKIDLDLFLGQPENRLVFPKFEKPLISFLMLTFNKAEYTFRCFKSIIAHANVPYEVILVDNASSDQTRDMLERVEGANVALNAENVHFLLGTNQAAKMATAPYLYLFNNDTELTAQTLSPLLDVFARRGDCGAVGSKLIWPNGQLQEAGSIVYSDASCLAYGRESDPNLPEFNYLREVDYCSGASLLIKRSDFEAIGGLDPFFAPAYYEEVDLCMKLRERGLKTYYQPKSVVVHYEFSSSSKEWAIEAMKTNCRKMQEKWKTVLATQHLECDPSETKILQSRDRKRKKNLLIIDDRVPCVAEGQGYARAYSMLKVLSDDYRITFFAKQSLEAESSSLNELRQSGVEVFCTDLDFESFIRRREGYYEIVMASRPHNFIQCLPFLKKYCSDAKLIYDAEALFFSRAFIQNQVIGRPALEACEKMRSEELAVMAEASQIIVVSNNEKAALVKELPHLKERVRVFGYALDRDETLQSFDQRQHLLFLGAFVSEESPNTDAIHYFVNHIFPKIRERLDCKLVIAGSKPTASVLALQADDIEVLGFVKDAKELYNRSRVFIVPHRFAGGIPLKLVECMSHGLPAVVSKLIGSQMNLINNEALIAESDGDFAEKVITLYTSPTMWHQTREKSLSFLEENFNPRVLHAQLKSFL